MVPIVWVVVGLFFFGWLIGLGSGWFVRSGRVKKLEAIRDKMAEEIADRWATNSPRGVIERYEEWHRRGQKGHP